MEKDKFDAIFPVIVSALADKIANMYHLPEDRAIEELYASQLYSALENEETKVWQYSTEKLFDLYKKEKEDGLLNLPEY